MQESFDAVFENGIFRPVTLPALPEGHPARVVVEAPRKAPKTPEEIDAWINLGRSIYEGLTAAEIAEMEQVMFDRSNWRSRELDL